MTDDDDPGFSISNPNRHLSPREVSLALKSANGSIIDAAEALGVPTAKLSRFIHARPKFLEMLKGFREALVDVAESHLIAKVHEGDWKAVQLTLTTLGRKRGFTTAEEKVKVMGATTPEQMSDAQLLEQIQKRVADKKLAMQQPLAIEAKVNKDVKSNAESE